MLLATLLCAQAKPDDKVQASREKVSKALQDDASYEAAWADYVAEFGAGNVMNLVAGPKTKDLPEPARAAAYKNNFKAALREMDKLNKQAERDGDDVAFGINSHAHLSAEEFAALRATGVRTAARRRAPRRAGAESAAAASPAAEAAETAAALTSGGRKLQQTCSTSSGQVAYTLGSTIAPAAVNWVSNGFVTPIRNQGQCGSCVAFATTVLTEFALMKRNSIYNNANTDLSEDDLMECEPTLSGCNGAGLNTYVSSVSCRGQSTEATAPYNYADSNYCPAGDTRAAERGAMKTTLNFQRAAVPRSNADLTRAVATAPTQIGVKADGYAFQYYTTGIVGCSVEGKRAVSNHAVTFVGYGVSGCKPYFLVKNSWGTGWGEAGFFRVQKDCIVSSKAPYGPFAMFASSPIVPVL
ncbi:hypothetical protein OEZ85_002846 [Tetradesmus obliquus]|uniref:Peptidase C1A papain C-terminal domain-containing protein n=1 Tax=Tetradesmus obliquus TaxID=3088 RepID=A0ABY8TZL1_TETOB|nr:hypothetical protein OEZ85_002846 [Tetradesmus obliquus]